MRSIFSLYRVFKLIAQTPANRMRHGYVSDKTGLKERFCPRKCAIDELINNNESARRQIFPERAAGAEGNNVGDAGHF